MKNIGYNLNSFAHDMRSAITCAFVVIPQSISYAIIADLPVVVGIYAAIFGTLFATFFLSSSHLLMGSSNAIAVLMQSAVATIFYTHFKDIDPVFKSVIALNLTILLTFLIGIFQCFATVFRLGKLTQFVSRSVISGYMLGVVFVVIVMQLYYFLGLDRVSGERALYYKAWRLCTQLRYIHFPSLAIGLGAIIFLLTLRKIKRFFPIHFLMLGIMSLLVYVWNLSPDNIPWERAQSDTVNIVQKVGIVRDIGLHQFELFNLSIPLIDWYVFNHLLPFAFAIALMSIMETSIVSKSIASLSGQQVSVNKDILGLGIGNICSSLFGAMPSSSGPGRSFFYYFTGPKTRFAGFLSAILVAVIIVFFYDLVILIPIPAIAAMLLITAYDMINTKQLAMCLKATRSDACVLLITFGSCIFFSINIAFYIGFFISIFLFLQRTANPLVNEYRFDAKEGLKLLTEDEHKQDRLVRIISVEGEFFFGSADFFETIMKTLSRHPEIKVVILHLRNARHLDATVCFTLENLYNYFKSRDKYLLLTSVPKDVYNILTKTEIVSLFGKEHIFELDEYASLICIQRALNKAEMLIDASKEQDCI